MTRCVVLMGEDEANLTRFFLIFAHAIDDSIGYRA